MKKHIATVLMATLITAPVYADTASDLLDNYLTNTKAPHQFTDMANTLWAAPSVEMLASLGIVNGFEDGTFRPENNITKAEFVKIIISAFGLYNKDAAVTLTDNNPEDWYYTYVSSALEKEIAFTDENGAFNPNQFITREEMFEVSKRAIAFADISLTDATTPILFTDNEDINPVYKESIDYMSSHGIVAGNADGTLNPKGNSTRAEASVMLTRMLNSALENEKQVFENLTNPVNTEVEAQ